MEWTFFLLAGLIVLAGMVVLPIFFGAPWHPLMPHTIRRILNFVDIRPGETICDLGCGDGRVLITAAKKYSAKGVGVEIDPIKLSNLKPSEELKNIRIGFDKKEILKDIIKKSKKIKPKISHKDFENTLYYLRDWHLYTAKHYSRGLKFSALGEVFDIRVLLLELYAKTKGLKDFEIKRNGEHFLSKKEMGFFRGEKISIGIKNIRKAMKDNWDFMKYIEKEYEKKTKKKLNLKCNDKEILKIINQLYDKK